MSRNYARLRGKIREVYGAESAFADELGMNRSTLSKKLNGKNDWSRSEIEKCSELLHIPVAEVYAYFFTM